MITSSNNETNGRLGNFLMRTASLIGLANKHNTKLVIPKSKYSKYFNISHLEGTDEELSQTFRKVKEPMFQYVPNWPCIDENENVDIDGYLQSKKYWDYCEEEVKDAFTFKEEIKQQVVNRFDKGRNVFQKETISISVRRGDYLSNKNYHILDPNYFILALYEHFPNWRDCNIIFFSDDIPYCRTHYDCIPNVFFSENNSDVEDLCLMSMCSNFIISNSTFSWFGAYLGGWYNKKVVRPNYLFHGELLRQNDFKDFYPDSWEVFDHKKEDGSPKKISLTDVTITIPVSYDHQDREDNLLLCIKYLRKHFEVNIIVYEQGVFSHFKNMDIGANIFKFDTYNGKFHRTKMLNDMARRAETMYIFNWDCDVLIAPMQILECVNQLRHGADMVYPYAKNFARIPRSTWFNELKTNEDIGIIGSTQFSGMEANCGISVGGAVGFNKMSFIAGGMENEKFISYSAEDNERIERFSKLGFRVERTIGLNLFHINHWIGVNSCTDNPYFEDGNKEFEKVRSMNREELVNYINTWSWC